MSAAPFTIHDYMESLEALTRYAMHERALIPDWGWGRKKRAAYLPKIDSLLDQWTSYASVVAHEYECAPDEQCEGV